MERTKVNVVVSYDYKILSEEVQDYYKHFEVVTCQYSVAMEETRGRSEPLFTCMIVYK